VLDDGFYLWMRQRTPLKWGEWVTGLSGAVFGMCTVRGATEVNVSSKKSPESPGLFSEFRDLFFFGFFLLLFLHRLVQFFSGDGFFFGDAGVGDSVLHDATLFDVHIEA